MLSCKEVVDRADTLIDGTPLTFKERVSLKTHVMMCKHCRRYVKQLGALVQIMSEQENSLAEEQVDTVMSRLD